jgi:hypothetical protein
LQAGLDSPNQIESVQQIAVYADAISEASEPVGRSDVQNNSPDLPVRQKSHSGKSAMKKPDAVLLRLKNSISFRL